MPPQNHPIPNHQIDLVYPLRQDAGRPAPFPTIYWLRPGDLHRTIADLERLGLIAQLEQRITDDATFRTEIHDDHRRYRQQRWDMLTPDDRATVEASPSLSRSFRGGVAGIADFDHIKCLHAHVAHALADRNAIGQLVLDELATPDT